MKDLVAKIEDLVIVRPVNGTNGTVDNVRNVGVVAARGTVAELLHFYSTVDSISELERSHIRSSTGTVDSEESETSDLQLVQVVVSVGQQLASFLGCGVWADRVVDNLVFGEEGGL